MESIELFQKTFQIYLQESQIQERIKILGSAITQQYKQANPLFIAVLNGSFMFASDLLKSLDFPCEIQFVKLSSYEGTHTTGRVQELIGLNQPILEREVIILEDIIDTGLTLFQLKQELDKMQPKSLAICSLLFKPKAIQVDLPIDFVGFEVENQFLIGYGLDFNGLGRNLKHIYQEIG